MWMRDGAEPWQQPAVVNSTISPTAPFRYRRDGDRIELRGAVIVTAALVANNGRQICTVLPQPAEQAQFSISLGGAAGGVCQVNASGVMTLYAFAALPANTSAYFDSTGYVI